MLQWCSGAVLEHSVVLECCSVEVLKCRSVAMIKVVCICYVLTPISVGEKSREKITLRVFDLSENEGT